MNRLLLVCLAVGMALATFDHIKAAEREEKEPTFEDKSLHEWLQDLHSSNTQTARQAAVALPQIGRPAIPGLIEALRVRDEKVRALAATALGRMGPHAVDAIPALLVTLQDKNADVSERSALALGRINPTGNLILYETPRFPNPPARTEQARVEPVKADPPKPMKPQPAPSKKSIDALMRDLHSLDRDTRLDAVRELTKIGAPAVPALIDALKDKDSTLRYRAAIALHHIGPDAGEAIPALAAALKDEDADVRETAAYALERMGPKAGAAVPALGELLKDPTQKVRRQAADTLVQVGPAGMSVLRQSMHEKDPKLLFEVIRALGDVDSSDLAEEAADILTQALDNPDIEVRRKVIAYLPRLGSAATRALPRLAELSPDEKLHDSVAGNLEPILLKVDGKDKKVVLAVILLLKDRRTFRYVNSRDDFYGNLLVLRAQGALERIGIKSSSSLPVVNEVLRTSGLYERYWFGNALAEVRTSKEAVPILLEAFRNKDEDIRRTAFVILGHMGVEAKEMVPAFGAALKDKDPEVRESAACALNKIGRDAAPVVPDLVEALHDHDILVRGRAELALIHVGAPAVPALIQVLTDTDDEVRRTAIFALGRIGPDAKEAVPILSGILKDKNEQMREEAARALRRIDPKAAGKAGAR